MTPLPTARAALLTRAAQVVGIVLVCGIFIGTAGFWPWDHDEVHSLVELGQVPVGQYPGPDGQIERMHRLVPVWTVLQNTALTVLPDNEWGTRVLPACAGVLAVLVAWLVAARVRGAWFGWSLLILMGGSQMLVWLSQQNRFYSLALLWFVATLVLTWLPSERRRYDVAVIGTTVAAVLSHNLTLVVVVLNGLAVCGAWAIGSASRTALRRALCSSAAAVGLYALYLRPILEGWVSGGTGGTHPLVSFVAQAGIAPVALALLGSVVALRDRTLHAWLALMALSIAFVFSAPWIMGAWNPRYGLFFLVPVWVVAAAGSAAVANAMETSTQRLCWLAVVLLIVLPKFGSHFIDGSRHDFRAAAAIVAGRTPALPVVSNWPATLQYYLEPSTGQRPTSWTPGDRLSDGELVVVLASNAWEPARLPGNRRFTVIGEIGRRRLDEQSHLIRIYRVEADAESTRTMTGR